MVKVNSFRALRPIKDRASEIICPPYDVVDTEEARELAGDNKNSFLHVVRSEIDFPPGHNPYGDDVYKKAHANLQRLISEGLMVRDSASTVFVYRLDYGEKFQYGLVSCLNVDDYADDRIKKHEFTRREKEDDRTKHIDTLGANSGLIYLMYKNSALPDLAVLLQKSAESGDALYDFTENSVRHRIYDAGKSTAALIAAAEKLEAVYIADGHHRAASSARVANMRRERAGKYDGSESFNWFLTVLFPDHQLNILPYNRAVQDLNGLSEEEFMSRVKTGFSVSEGKKDKLDLHEFNMYLGGGWYTLRAGEALYANANEVDSLDVSILQNNILSEILGVDDPRTSERIKFVGGIRGDSELEKLVKSGKFAVAFSLHPVTTSQLISISDAGKVMPPKSTWFEPKLKSGFLVNLLD